MNDVGCTSKESFIAVEWNYNCDFSARDVEGPRTVTDEPSWIMADIHLGFFCKRMLVRVIKHRHVNAELLD